MMPTNPLEDDAARDQRIRERAYQLWKEDGEPNGSDIEYWERARELIAMQDSQGAGQVSVADDDARRVNGQFVEEASIQANLGEFPDRLSDQGERPQTPSPKARRKAVT